MDTLELARLNERYGGKKVVVDLSRPELQRWADCQGTIRVINGSGRALVEFNQADSAWYDIHLDYLQEVEEEDSAEEAEE